MARQDGEPWFRKVKNAWYVWHEGRQISLGVKGEGSRKEALQAWHRLMAGQGCRKPDIPPRADRKAEEPTEPEVSVKGLVNAYLAEAKERISERAYVGYERFLTAFVETLGKRDAESIRPHELEASSRKEGWSLTYRANYLNQVVMAYRWGVRSRLIRSNPLEDVRKPHRASRGATAVIADDEHRLLIAAAKPDTRDLLEMLWSTGARPGEITGLTAEMVRASADGVIPLTEHKTAHRGKSRFLILTGEAWAIAQRRAKTIQTGLLFPNEKGERLTAQAIGHRLKKLCKRAGVRHRMAYGYRHAYATDALANGVPDATVAALLGHSSTAMLHKHYSHLTSKTAVLRQAAGMVRR